ncbi:MAG TPA: LuxR C-terminal-related transcriptional regulator [Jatrophihabitans sp.]|nr:LuxR C-terminal-related transcriptional regulator [Jatrophihabitans sp.]
MVVGAQARRLLGRQRERAVLDRLLDSARDGRGAVVAVHGEPGVGKTALLTYAVEAAVDFRVLQAAGAEGEMALDFSALQQFCSPILENLHRLPGPQRDALQVAFGLRAGQAPAPFLVGLAVLGLLSEAAEQQPLLCLLDDAQWLDDASGRALPFVARRLLAERIALVFAAREPIESLAGFAQLHVGPLGRRDARALLDSVLPGRLDERVMERIVAEARGNPLALLELPRGLTPGQLAGGFGLPAALPLFTGIEQSFMRRLARLPRYARRLLLVAAAEPLGDPALLWRAAKQLRISETAADAVESEGLLTLDGAVAFRHPLVRSAVYGAAEPNERREVHRALADASDPQIDPDRRAWHRAQATSAPDEQVASELEQSAARAQARGGYAAAAAFLERSVALTVDPARRAARALRAAETNRLAGALDAALGLATLAEQGPLDDLQRAQVDVVLGRIAFAGNRGNDASPLMLKAASRLEQVDPKLARETYLDALTAALFAGRLATDANAQVVAAAACAAPRADEAERASDRLLEGLALLITDGFKSGTPVLKQAISAFRADDVRADEQLRWSWLAGAAAGFIWDHESWDVLTTRAEQLARDVGALTVLPITLSTRAGLSLFAGEVAQAAFLVDQVQIVTGASDNQRLPNAALTVAAFRGEEREARQLIEAMTKDSLARGEGLAVAVAQWATAVLCNGLGQYDNAYRAAMEALKDPNDLWYSGWATVELVEAASRTGNTEHARPALKHLAESTDASGTDWALAVQARCRALLSDTEEAETLYREAIERLLPTRLRLDLARTRLVYGEWLRRQSRRVDARKELRIAYEMFTDFGMEAFSGRARVELRATGERARSRTVDTLGQLTPQEEQISRLVAQGRTNREIAAQLFISPSTVEYHLHKAFRKLGAKSRAQLARRMK